MKEFFKAVMPPLIPFLLILGFIFWLVGSFHVLGKFQGFDFSRLNSLLSDLGSIVLGAGFFTVILQSAQFTELFERHITWVFYDPAKIKNQKVVIDRWKVMTQSLLKSVLPNSYRQATNSIYKQFFNSELHCHFENYSVRYDIDIDEEADTIKIKSYVTADLVITEDVDDPVLKQEHKVKDGKSSLTQLRIDSTDIDIAAFLEKKTDKAFEIKLPLRDYRDSHNGVVRYEKRVVIEQSLSKEPYIVSTVSRYMKGATEVVVKVNHEDYTVVFYKSGLGSMPEDGYSQVEDGIQIWTLAKGNDLLLPGQGYTIFIHPKKT